MDIREILELVGMVVGTAGLGLLFYFYFTNAKVKSAVDQGLKYLPTVLGLAKGFVKDKKDVFDAYDALVVTERLSVFFRETVTDPTNTNFLDVEEEAFTFLKRELDRYKKAGVRGVPDIDDQVLRTNVKVVFEQIVRALSEDVS